MDWPWPVVMPTRAVAKRVRRYLEFIMIDAELDGLVFMRLVGIGAYFPSY
jgi:hypothetical protein